MEVVKIGLKREDIYAVSVEAKTILSVYTIMIIPVGSVEQCLLSIV